MFTANITTSQESGVVSLTDGSGNPRPTPFGFAEFVLNDDMSALSFTATIFNIDVTGSQTPGYTTDNLMNAHIHAGANNPPANNGVVFGFFGSPFNDIAPNDATMTPFGTGVGGVFTAKWDALEGNNGTTLAAQLANIFAGRSYINFHTSQNPGGEIRGLIATPEPATGFLIAAGAAVCALRRRRG